MGSSKVRVGWVVSLFCVLSQAGVREAGAEDRRRLIGFGPYHWEVLRSDHLVYNKWSSDPESVWVDDRGRLHLKLRRAGGEWYAAQVKTLRSFGYGDYRFQLGSNTERFDPAVNVGLFVYRDTHPQNNHEIDIELTRFGNEHEDAATAHYTVQPYHKPENVQKFKMNLTGGYTTHRFVWKPDSIMFQSYHGHADDIRSLPPKERLIREWVYTGADIPKPHKEERLYINIFLWNHGEPPEDGKEREVVVNNVRVLPVRVND